MGRREKGVVKGAPSGLLISLMVHAGAFLLAGLLVVFTVQQQKEQRFVPPKPVEKPKMKLKKPKVQIKKAARPKSTSHIVTHVKRANMPNIELPEFSGVEGGSIGDIGGWGMFDGLGLELTPFGEAITTGSDLKGHFYDFKRDRSGHAIPMDPNQLEDLIHTYMKGGWNDYKLARYYRAPRPLYSTTVCIPTVLSEIAPWAFGEMNTIGYCWAVLYEGELVYPEDITFRFWGVGDKFMGIQVDGETVLFCAYRARTRAYFSDVWDTKDPKDHTYYFAEARARPSDWITLKANEPKKIKILLGDLDGGLVYHIVSVEVKGEKYPNTRAGGGPTFPVFRTSEIPRDVMDVIYSCLYPGDACLTNGPIFRDFASKPVVAGGKEEDVPPPPALKDKTGNLRTWTMVDGKTVEGRLRTLLGSTVILDSDRGKQQKLPLDQLSEEDRDYVEMLNPPAFDINWSKTSNQVPNPPPSPYAGARPLQLFDFQFGVDIKQTSTANLYDEEVLVEYFAVGEEIDGNQYVLLDRKSAEFNPAEFKGKTFELKGDNIRLRWMAYRPNNPVRGTKYGGYLVTLTDKEGDIIAYKASHEFLFENLNKLRGLRRNNCFNRECDRVFPTQPTEDNRGNGAINGAG